MINTNEVASAELSEHKLNQFNDRVYGYNDDESDELTSIKGRLVELNFDDID